MPDPSCQHPDVPHTVWWWVEDGDPVPAPRSLTLDNRAHAMTLIADAVANPPVHLRWIKVFRADNEAYTCWQWDNPTPMPAPAQAPAPASASAKKVPHACLYRRRTGMLALLFCAAGLVAATTGHREAAITLGGVDLLLVVSRWMGDPNA